ncbi:DUF86 domain-containing protein [Cohnella faecalis]|uniref:DUF86 domain-containing protein n=1 Tax=Cohnella faecalis TaxID=2315694 RepID=A0A398CID1_9BACL|nr:HepT-like ribonuclease domain-containing protein [Cohnella faecalis]RIE03036.1 DUF86 domain-containing protein [Cohnella faecalis]
MYYVNREGIDSRLNCIPEIVEALAAAASDWRGTLAEGLAQERALHLAAEIVTDIGSALIDGFLMRDASSYEDIIEIIATEQVISPEVSVPLTQLVALRKALVQQYDTWPRRELHPLSAALPALLNDFAIQVRGYLAKELG